MGACSPVLISSHYPESQLLIANMPSYWSSVAKIDFSAPLKAHLNLAELLLPFYSFCTFLLIILDTSLYN